MRLPASIIVTCYEKDRQLLPRALKSCLEQNCAEIILVDDGSKERISEEVSEIIQHNPITFVRHARNSGLSAARNTGIKLSAQPFFIPLDADDYFYLGAVEGLLDSIRDGDVCTGNITQDSKVVHIPPIQKHPATWKNWMSANLCFASSLYRKSIWEKVGGYKVMPHAFYEDFEMGCRCHIAGAKFVYSNTLVYNHALRSDSMLQQLHSRTKEFHALSVASLGADPPPRVTVERYEPS